MCCNQPSLGPVPGPVQRVARTGPVALAVAGELGDAPEDVGDQPQPVRTVVTKAGGVAQGTDGADKIAMAVA